MQTPIAPLPMEPENEEIAAELRYLDSIADLATITVRQYLEGEDERPVYLHTHHGALRVTGVHFFGDGPWLVTGHGFHAASWCVAYNERLYFSEAEAERQAS